MRSIRWVMAMLGLALGAEAAAGGTLASLAVYDRTEGKPLPVYWHEGRAYVVGRPGNEYQLSLKSRSGGELLAVVSVDGVNVITGETAHPGQSGYVLAPRRPLAIQGWRKSLGETAAFYFTALPDSYAARTGRPDHVGVIGVALFRKKAEAAPIARSQPHARRDAAGNASGAAQDAAPATSAPEPLAESAKGMLEQDAARLGTGHGRREASPARYVSFERASSTPAELLTIHYDSHRNLVARGVIRAPAPPQPLPQPFPAFVPDPRPSPYACPGFAPAPWGC